MKTLIEEEMVVPHYLPLRSYQVEESYHILDLGGGEQFKRLRLDEKAFQVFKLFFSPHTPSSIAIKLGLPPEDIVRFCSSLKQEGLLVPHEPVPGNYERYSRHLQYFGLCGLNPKASQEKLSHLKIALIGVGGIGNWIGLNLVGLGIQHLRLVDHDIIEETNLPRQVLFTEADIGKSKIDVAAREFQQRNQKIELELIQEQVNEMNITRVVSGADFVILSADQPFFKIQRWTNEACVKAQIPFLNVGYSATEGIIGPLVVPGISACLNCNKGLTKTNDTPPVDESFVEFHRNYYITPSFVCLNSFISCMASYEVVKYFLNFGECISLNHLVSVDPCTFSINKLFIERNTTCTTCRHLR